MTAAAVLARIRAADGDLALAGEKLVLGWDGDPPPDLVATIRERKAALIELLTPRPFWPPAVPPTDPRLRADAYCRFCGNAVDWSRPAVAFGDDTAAHALCYLDASSRRQS